MNPLLSIVVPVHNAQDSLARQVGSLLDVLPDLVWDFEILIVDDASTDQTEEVAIELAQQFPQVRVFRHAQRQGTVSAVNTGLEQTVGQVVFVHNVQSHLSPSGLRQLWNLRDDSSLLMAQASAQPEPLDPGLMERLAAWGLALKGSSSPTADLGGIQMIRRKAVESLSQLEMEDQRLMIDRRARMDRVSYQRSWQKPPNIMNRLKEFTSGE